MNPLAAFVIAFILFAWVNVIITFVQSWNEWKGRNK